MTTSAAETELVSSYPALARQPLSTDPSAKFVEQPKLLTKTRKVPHRVTLNALTSNKNIRVGEGRNLQKFDKGSAQALKRAV